MKRLSARAAGSKPSPRSSAALQQVRLLTDQRPVAPTPAAPLVALPLINLIIIIRRWRQVPGKTAPHPYSREMPTVDLTEDERAALVAFLRDAIAADRFPMSAPLLPIKSVLAKFDPQPAAAITAAETGRPSRAWCCAKCGNGGDDDRVPTGTRESPRRQTPTRA